MKPLHLFAAIAVCLTACRSQFPIAYDASKAKNPQYKCYVKTSSGDIISSDELRKKNENKLFKPTLFIINDSAIKSKDVVEYQDYSGNYKRLAGELTKALSGPHLMVYKQEYTYQSYEGPSMGRPAGRWTTSRSVRYLLQKSGQEETLTVGLQSTGKLAEWVEDYDEAYEQAVLAGQYSKKIKMHRLISWGGIIGGVLLAAADPAFKNNADPNKKLGVLGNGGIVLFSGGVVNLCLNLGRRGKAGRAYAAAINLYNEKPEKKKR